VPADDDVETGWVHKLVLAGLAACPRGRLALGIDGGKDGVLVE
jgi:hypothetical protein